MKTIIFHFAVVFSRWDWVIAYLIFENGNQLWVIIIKIHFTHIDFMRSPWWPTGRCEVHSCALCRPAEVSSVSFKHTFRKKILDSLLELYTLYNNSLRHALKIRDLFLAQGSYTSLTIFIDTVLQHTISNYNVTLPIWTTMLNIPWFFLFPFLWTLVNFCPAFCDKTSYNLCKTKNICRKPPTYSGFYVLNSYTRDFLVVFMRGIP
jgi:hypothetical protein